VSQSPRQGEDVSEHRAAPVKSDAPLGKELVLNREQFIRVQSARFLMQPLTKLLKGPTLSEKLMHPKIAAMA
jgi:hypothetical protein